MEASDLDNVSADTRTDKVIDAYKYLSGRIEQIQIELSILNGWLEKMPVRFLTGSTRVLTRKDFERMEKSTIELFNNHDLYCAEFIIMEENLKRVIRAAQTRTDRSFQ
jgi:hypothetical protein